MIDRDDSDNVIVEKTFNLAVAEKQVENNNNGNDNTQDDKVLDNKTEENNNNNNNNNNGEKLPETLPKTGTTKYAIIFTVIGMLSVACGVVSRKNMK